MITDIASPPLLEMEGITKAFGDSIALGGVSMAVGAGSVHCIVGENGAGKSTLMKILAGLYQADDGEIRLSGKPVRIRSSLDGLKQGIGVVYQELELVPDLSVAENIGLGHEPLFYRFALNRAKLRTMAERVLRMVGLLVPQDAPVSELTVSERQLLAIAKTLSFDPAIIVFDEPSAVLGGRDLENLFEIIHALQEEGRAIIYISHRLEEIFHIGDLVTVLRDGHVVETMKVSDATPEGLVQLMVGRDVSRLFPPRREVSDTTERLVVEKLTGRVVVDASFTIHVGEIVGCAGLVGCGLDELARLVSGIEGAVRGRISINGAAVRPWNPRQAIKAGVGLVPEDRKTEGLLLNQSILDNAAYSAVATNGYKLGLLNRRELSRMVSRYRDTLNIKTTTLKQSVESLSGGNQQKVVLAKILATNPNVLILDEPTRGVDVGTKSEIYQIIVDLAAQGASILLISSELTELMALSHRILVFAEGHMTAEMNPPYVDTEILSKALPTLRERGGM